MLAWIRSPFLWFIEEDDCMGFSANILGQKGGEITKNGRYEGQVE